MSELTGHATITARAVEQLVGEMRDHPVIAGLPAAGLPSFAQQIDILDVASLGHWVDRGQKHHFMRRFNGQSHYEAYLEGVAWVRSEALCAAQTLAQRLSLTYPGGIPARGGVADPRARQVFGGTPQAHHSGMATANQPDWSHLGNAVHALQDSFSPSHAERDAPVDESTPGGIRKVKLYVGREEVGHKEGDAAWREGSGSGLSALGKLAMLGTKALLLVVIETAMRQRPPQDLLGWEAFRGKWLSASREISSERDVAMHLIHQNATRLPLFTYNLKTLNMDEEGLAAGLIEVFTARPDEVLEAFEILDDKYNSDADDVAELFVRAIAKRGGSHVETLRRNTRLIDLLIKTMDEGWTTSGEKKCIDWLKRLKSGR